jgi:glycosyltransferase involved in cell wall biosynthesis
MNKNAPKVSVVMSCYNAEKYLRPAIDSILNQTFCDFEFIIWNDGSTDSTEEIIKSYSDSRIRYFYHENTGLGRALNLACKEALGEYIARMDADDIALPNRFEKEVEFLDKNKDYILVSSAVNYINEEGEYLGRSFPYTWDCIIKGAIYSSSFIVHPAVMFRRISYLASDGYMNVFGGEDIVLWGRMQKYGKYANLSIPLLNYRLLSDSLSHCVTDNFYTKILREFRRKMAAEEKVNENDLLLHNQIFVYAKRLRSSVQNQSRKSFPEVSYRINHLYGLFSKYLKENILNSILVFGKNIYGYLKYSLKK